MAAKGEVYPSSFLGACFGAILAYHEMQCKEITASFETGREVLFYFVYSFL
jgi:hypothetical protein